MYKDGATYLLVIEWDTGEEPDPDDLEQPETCGAYEYAEAVAPHELEAAILGAKEEARDLLDSNGSGWVSVLVGVGEGIDDVDAENAEQVITFTA